MVGETNKNTSGTEMIIIAERNHDDIDVEFLDDYHFIKEHATYLNFKRGHIKNPFDKTVYGMGCFGFGEYVKDNIEAYKCWTCMIERCYASTQCDRHTAYYGVVQVSYEWQIFQNFAKWYKENKYECNGRLHLDKDIKYPGNKIYSPYHCILLPQSINEQYKSNGHKKEDLDLPYTIRRDGLRYKVSYRGKQLGIYNTIEEATIAYEDARYNRVIELINDYPNMPDTVKEILINSNKR